jgi:hypothetical protein
MKTLSIPLNLVLAILIIGVAGCSSQVTQPAPTAPLPTELPPTPTPVPEATPLSGAATVEKMVERMNAGDLEGSLANFADEAMVYFIGLPPTGIEVYTGKEQIRALWQDSIANHFQWEIEITQVNGNQVFVKAKTWHDFTRQLGVAPLDYNDVYELKDGKIITYGSTITKEAWAKFRPALAKVMPPEATATPSSTSPVSEMTVNLEGGTCTTDTPLILKAGQVQLTWNVKDQDNSLYALTMFTLDQDKDILDLMVSTYDATPPSWAGIVFFEESEPGKNGLYTFTVEKGPVYLICWSKPPDLPIGNAGPIEVKE